MRHVPVVMDVEQVMEKVYMYVVSVVWCWAVPVIWKGMQTVIVMRLPMTGMRLRVWNAVGWNDLS